MKALKPSDILFRAATILRRRAWGCQHQAAFYAMVGVATILCAHYEARFPSRARDYHA